MFEEKWFIAVKSIIIFVCLSSTYGWSIIANILIQELGIVTPSKNDWIIQQTTFPYQIQKIIEAFSALLFSNFQQKNNVQKCLFFGSILYSFGYFISSIGVYFHNLHLICLGYGFLSGCGQGLIYVPIIKNINQWFTDKKGFAIGLVLIGYGLGPIFSTPLIQFLLQNFQQMPQYMGPKIQSNYIYKEGIMFVNNKNQLQEVVYATQQDLAARNLNNILHEGLYKVNSGQTGSYQTLFLLGMIYLILMLSISQFIDSPQTCESNNLQVINNNQDDSQKDKIKLNIIFKSIQFKQLVSIYFIGASIGYTLISIAKTILIKSYDEIFPDYINNDSTNKFLILLTIANISGRFMCGFISDYISRPLCLKLLVSMAILSATCIPFLNQQIFYNQLPYLLFLYIVFYFILVFFFGGIMSLIPAYETDLFGNKYFVLIHSKIFFGQAIASIFGPSIFMFLSQISEKNYVYQLLSIAEQDLFKKEFGLDIKNAEILLETKSLNINKLMKILPQTVKNPQPFIFNTGFIFILIQLILALVISFKLDQIDEIQQEDFEEKIQLIKNN